MAEKVFLISFPCFKFIRKLCKTRFLLSQKNTKMLKTKKLPWQPLLFSIIFIIIKLWDLKENSCLQGETLPNFEFEAKSSEKPFKRKRKGNDLDLKVSCVFWWDRHCRVAHRQNRVVRKFTHAHIAILASSYSDDVVAIEVKK